MGAVGNRIVGDSPIAGPAAGQHGPHLRIRACPQTNGGATTRPPAGAQGYAPTYRVEAHFVPSMTRLLFLATPLLMASLLAVLGSALPAWRPIQDTITIPALVAMPSLRAEWVTPNLVLRGVVPDEAERRAIRQRAHALFGEAHVEDAMTVAEVANPAWLSPEFLPDLRHALRARVQLVDASLEVDGVVTSEQARDALLASLAAYRSRGVKVIDRLVLRETAPPPPRVAPAPVR